MPPSVRPRLRLDQGAGTSYGPAAAKRAGFAGREPGLSNDSASADANADANAKASAKAESDTRRRSNGLSWALGGLVVIAVAGLRASHRAGGSWLELEPPMQGALLVLGCAYAASGVATAWFARAASGPSGFERCARSVVVTVAFLAGAVVLLDLRHVELDRWTTVLAIGSALVLALLREILSRAQALHLALLGGMLVALGVGSWAASRGAFDDARGELRPQFIDSHLYGLLAHHRPLPALHKPGGGIPIPPREYRIEPGGGIREGGGVVRLPGGYLLVSGAGDFYWITRPDPAGELAVRELEIDVPFNPAAFERDAGGDPVVRYWNFRVQDVEVQSRPNGLRVFVSHHFWNAAEACYVVRVSSFESAKTRIEEVGGDVVWQTLFESQPCIPIKTFPRGQRFAGEESGGRLALRGEDTLLLTLGDHEHDGLNSERALAQDPGASYGKIVAISLADARARFHSIGHRNPQGLYVGADGVVWSTEHGPEGGDELNRIEAGGNYGWPLASYGVDYGETSWPLGAEPGSHAGYREPVYAWVPSIGVSNLVGVRSSRFPAWRDDLLVASLRDRGLWRMRIRNGGLVVNERIEIGVRMRDIIEGHEGEIVIYSDENPRLIFLEPAGELQTPEAAFAVCRGCHTVEGTVSAIGPNLRGVVGREIASYSGYPYSAGLAALEGRWDTANLDAYLRDPQTFAPGTSMALPGIESEAQRALVIEYLESL